MIVCHCHRITDREIRAAVRRGEIPEGGCCRALLAGTGCGGCRRLVDAIVDAELAGGAPRPEPLYLPAFAAAARSQ